MLTIPRISLIFFFSIGPKTLADIVLHSIQTLTKIGQYFKLKNVIQFNYFFRSDTEVKFLIKFYNVRRRQSWFSCSCSPSQQQLHLLLQQPQSDQERPVGQL